MMTRAESRQRGASLIEVLVAVLILSFGLLAVGGMMGQAVHVVKLSGNRAVASLIVDDLVERIRANAPSFDAAAYQQSLSYDGSTALPAIDDCNYPDCKGTLLATRDLQEASRNARRLLPAGGLLVERSAPGEGRVFVVWDEPGFAGTFNSLVTDTCPAGLPAGSSPRCLLVSFKL